MLCEYLKTREKIHGLGIKNYTCFENQLKIQDQDLRKQETQIQP